MADIVEIDDGAQLTRQFEIGGGRVVGREHDLVARDAQRARDHELGVARAIAAATVFVEDLDERGIGIGFYGKVLAESRVPGKRLAHRFHVAAHARLIVEVKGGRYMLDDTFELFL